MSTTQVPIDKYVEIKVDENLLSASLRMVNMDDTFTCTYEQLEAVLINNNIVYGTQSEKLKQICKNPQSFSMVSVVVAEGLPPRNGMNGFIEYIFDMDSHAKKPLELEDGTVNFKEITSLKNIRKGEIIAKKILPTEGIIGQSVTGEVLPAKDGIPALFKLGKNVITDSEKLMMIADSDGIVTKTDKDKINVFPVYEINGDLDFRIGNIDFVGTVVIRGHVLPGFKIKASGDIRITGGVEGADLEANGSILIGQGVLGHHKGIVKAGTNITCSFVQEGRLEAGEDIIVSQSIMHSVVRAAKNVICNGSRGLIVGGTIQAGEKVIARTIGNSLSTVTVLEVGVIPELRNEMLDKRKQLTLITEQLSKTSKALELLNQLAAIDKLAQDKVIMRVKLNNTKKELLIEESQIKDRMLEIEKSIKDVNNAKIDVTSTIHSGSKIVIGRATKFIKDNASAISFVFSNGDITLIPYV